MDGIDYFFLFGSLGVRKELGVGRKGLLIVFVFNVMEILGGEEEWGRGLC